MSPLLPRSFEQTRANKSPDVLGEEGALYNLGAVWLKRWNASHEQGIVPIDRYSESSTLSPYWAKFQFYQNKVIHGLFPEDTFSIKAAYDTRVSSQNGETRFMMNGGKPTTISEAVDTSTEAASAYTRIVYPLYRETAPLLDEIRTPGEVPDDLRNRYDDTFDIAEDGLLEMIEAEEFRLFHGNNNFGAKSIEEHISILEQKVTEINPRSSVLKFLKAGIIPIHPSLNFIPKDPSAGMESPQGTYMELSLMSPARLMKAVAEHNGKNLEPSMGRMFTFGTLDAIFTNIIFVVHENEQAEDNWSVDVQSTLFGITEELRKAGDALGYNTVVELGSQVMEHVHNILTTQEGPESAHREMERMRESLRAYIERLQV